MNAHFLEPLDVLFLRGNRLFGDAGSYGESMVPPWPSVAAGAIRSSILARDGVDLAAFARGEVDHAGVGRRDAPGDFRITDFQLAWHGPEGKGPLESLYPLPADLVVTRDDDGHVTLRRLSPIAPTAGVGCSSPTALLPVMAQSDRAKPMGGLWLTEAGMRDWLGGRLPDTERHLVSSEQLWLSDERVGIGMDAVKRRADDGKLFTMQAVALRKGVGFLATVEGDGLDDGAVVRFGGDGRAAAVSVARIEPAVVDYGAILDAGRCRIVLTTPGLFGIRPLPSPPPQAGEGENGGNPREEDDGGNPQAGEGVHGGNPQAGDPAKPLSPRERGWGEGSPSPDGSEPGQRAGWLPFDCDANGRFEWMGIRGRLVCAAVPRAEVVSGWDLARWQPKPAHRAALAGSVYWLEELDATEEQLRKLADHGLWPESGYDALRRAEGFNRFLFATY